MLMRLWRSKRSKLRTMGRAPLSCSWNWNGGDVKWPAIWLFKSACSESGLGNETRLLSRALGSPSCSSAALRSMTAWIESGATTAILSCGPKSSRLWKRSSLTISHISMSLRALRIRQSMPES